MAGPPLSGKAAALQVKGMMISRAANPTIGKSHGEKLPKSPASDAGRAKIEAATAPLKARATAPMSPIRRGRETGSLRAENVLL
jgi:hypothetical protein